MNYGRITNNVRLQDARLLELIASYQNTVLVANQEAEDALIAFLKSKREVISLRKGVDDLNESLKLLLIQFEEGSIDFSPIFVLQGSLRSAQDQMAAAEGQVLLNMVSVYRALGGGWQIRYPGFETQVLSMGEVPADTTNEPFLAPGNGEEEEEEEFLMPAPGVVPKEDSEDGQ